MKVVLLFIFAFGNLTTIHGQNKYPPTKVVDSSDIFWQTKIDDPYRWLEDFKDPVVVEWLKKQSDFTNNILNKIPGKELLVQELLALEAINTVTYSSISKAGSKYFYHKKHPEELAAKIYCREGKFGAEKLLFDPVAFSPNKPIKISSSFSDDGLSLLIRVSEDGKEAADFHVIDVATGKMFPDILPHSMFADFVAGSNNEILYFKLKNYDAHDPDNELNPKTLLHRIGTPVSTDLVILSEDKYPNILDSVGWAGIKTFSGSSFMFIEKSTSSNYKKIYYAPLADLKSSIIDWKILCEVKDEVWQIIVDKDDIYCITSKDNSYFRILKTAFPEPDIINAKEIFKGSKDWKLAVYGDIIETYKSADHLILNLSKNELAFKTVIYDLKTGTLTQLKVPLEGSFTAIPMSDKSNELRIVNYGWTLPNTQYIYDLSTKDFTKGPFHTKVNYPGSEHLVSEEIEIPSHDGVLVPLTLI